MTLKMPSNKSISFYLIIYRWITLAHILLLLILRARIAVALSRGYLLFFLATFYVLILTFFHSHIYRQISQHPTLLGIDLLICALLMSFGGGWRNAWYLYSFSPILAGSLFYKMRGGLIAAGISNFAYSFSLYINGYTFGKMIQIGQLDGLVSNLFSYFLTAIFFAYPCIIIDSLERIQIELVNSNKTLEIANKQLSILYELSPLTEREKEILQLIAQPKTNKEIAQSLYISEETVKSHLKNIFNKLKFKSRTQAALYFSHLNLDDAQNLSNSLSKENRKQG